MSNAAARSRGDRNSPAETADALLQLLDGIVVVDLSRALAGPHAGMMFGDLGARVIKVEHPDGDDTRGWGPPFVGEPGTQESTYFLSCNRNKESVTADLKSAEGRSLLSRLLQRADVLIENFRPGVLDRLGFPIAQIHEINPRVIVCSMTGFGHDGPEGGRPGYDQIVQGEAGLMSVTGPDPEQPTKVGVSIGDILMGMNGVIGILAALRERDHSGRGRVVRTSLLASIVGVHAFQGTRWTVAGEVPHALGNHHPSISPYGLFRTRDTSIQLAVGNHSQWKALAGLLTLDADDVRFASNVDRVTHRGALTGAIEEKLSAQGAAHWLAALAEVGVPAGKVRSIDDVYRWEQTRSQGLIVEVDHPTLGPIDLPGSPLRFDDQQFSGRHRRNQPPPRLGEHNESITAWLAMSESTPDD